jgi:peptide-methionine (S)-S-oxide reductase
MAETKPMLATFGAGCFWGVEEVFRTTPGVTKTTVGYEGGQMENPTYEDVCTDATGHAEVVQIEFDPSKVTYERLLDIFFSNHNPTTLNRQGPDVGTQYRSAIFYHDEAQKKQAEAAKEKWNTSGRWDKPVVTSLEKAQVFYKAEDYHQQYLAKRGLSTCHI